MHLLQTVDQIPLGYGISIAQKWKHFAAIQIAGRGGGGSYAFTIICHTTLRRKVRNSPISFQMLACLTNIDLGGTIAIPVMC